MEYITQYKKDLLESLDIILRNFKNQTNEQDMKGKFVEVEFFLDDFSSPNSSNGLNTVTFMKTVSSFGTEEIKLEEYDQDLVLSQEHELGPGHTPFCKIMLPTNFEEIYQKLRFKVASNIHKTLMTKRNLADAEISFDDNKTTLMFGSSTCSLPPFANEHYLCRAMFSYPKLEPVDWSTIYEKMFGLEHVNDNENLRTVQDAMYAVNDRINEVFNTDDKLFKWENKTIRRNF